MSKSVCTRESLILCLAIAAAGGYSFFTPFIKKLFANGVYPARKITADIARTMEKTLAEKMTYRFCNRSFVAESVFSEKARTTPNYETSMKRASRWYTVSSA